MKKTLGLREQLFHLLAEAAEVEHTLMCSYLYVAFSLRAKDDVALSAAERAAVARWRETILGVAIEEMSHLLVVANVSAALGGRPHLARPNFPVSPGYFPSGVAVKLAPFSEATLDHLIFLERPRGVKGHDGPGFQEADYRREEAYEGLMPGVRDYRTVGDLYEVLKSTLTQAHEVIGTGLFIGGAGAQVDGKLIGAKDVRPVLDLPEAIAALDTIVEQGEGSPGDREDSHYRRFQMVRSEYETLRAANPSFAPARPSATNPVMRRPPDPEDKVFVEHPEAARVLDFANAVYGHLLRLLVQAFGRSGPRAADEQRDCIDAAVHLMHAVDRLGSLLARLPATPSAQGDTAGLTFTMLRGVEPLLQGEGEILLLTERWQELRDEAEVLEARHGVLEGLTSRVTAALPAFARHKPR